MVAAGNGHHAFVEKLLQEGSGVDIQNQFGLTALRCATSAGHIKCFALLIGAKAGVNLRMIREDIDIADTKH